MGVESHTCLQEETVVFQTDSTIYRQLSLFYNSITESINTQTIHENDTDKYEYFINTEDFVGKFITDERISDYYVALKGRTKEAYLSQQKFCECVSSMRLVAGTRKETKVIYTSSCIQYWKTQYYPHAVYYQYNNRLKSLSVIIPTNRVSNEIRYDRRCTSKPS